MTNDIYDKFNQAKQDASARVMYSLGDFKFTSKTNVNSMSRDFESGIEFQDRISNHAYAVVAKKWEETITIEGETIPAQGTGLRALDALYSLACQQKPQMLTSGIMECFGNFMIISISEGRKAFTTGGAFMKQSFNLTLRRVEDA